MTFGTVFALSISFGVTIMLLPAWIAKARSLGLIWPDMNKFLKPKVAGSGGMMMVLGFIAGILFFIAYRIFVVHTSAFLVEMLALLLVIVFSAGIGFVDDLIGWQHGGLSKRSRILLLMLVAVPLMAINAGKHTMLFPFLGKIDIGLLYPFFLIPLGVVGAAATFNFLAGYNGLEAGQGILILSALGIVALFTGSSWLAVILFCMVAALLAFLLYNKYPAQVFPGDSLTYAVGSLIATVAILGNFEKIAVFFFIPYILETFLKLRGSLKKYSFALPQKDGSLSPLYKNIYGLEHAAIFFLKKVSIQPTEQRVVALLWIFQLLIILLGFIIFKEGIFIST